MKLTKIVLPLILLLVVAYVSTVSGSESRSQKLSRILEERAKIKNKLIDYTGKLVDLEGNPVPNAQVSLDVNYVDPKTGSRSKVLISTTDSDGKFSLQGKGFKVYLKDIEAEGYDFNNTYNDRISFKVDSGAYFNDVGSDDADFILKVRKKEKPALILTGGHVLNVTEPKNYYIDLYGHRLYREHSLVVARDKGRPLDIKISSIIEGDDCFVAFFAMEGAEEIYIDDKVRHRYISKGTKFSHKLKLEDALGKLVYIKGVGGEYYARIHLDYDKAYGEKYLKLSYGYNPEGNTSLEYDPLITRQYFDDVKQKKRKPIKRGDYAVSN